MSIALHPQPILKTSAILVLFLFIAMIAAPALALTPSGTVIGNQAVATYQESGNSFTAASNLVTITVSQVAGVSLLPATQGMSGAPGTEVQFPHTLTNTGNGSDTYSLATTQSGADNFNLSSLVVIRDDNGNGVADPGEPTITSVTLAMNAAQALMVRGTIPSSALPTQTGVVSLTATSGFNGAVSASSTDTATATGNAVISVTKSASAAAANPGATIDYTINETNTGIATATGVDVIINGAAVVKRIVIRDLIPANTTFSSFLGTPSPTGGQQVFHVTGAALQTYVTAQPPSFDAVAYLFGSAIGGLSQGQTGSFAFRVTINSSALGGTISNTAVVYFNNSSADTSQTGNTTSTTVNQVARVIVRATDGTDLTTVASAPAGTVVAWANRVINSSNATDTFNITTGGSTFPAGTTFNLFKADGVSPLLDTNADGIPDTGPMTAAATLDLVIKATLPATASGGPYSVIVTGRSISNPTVSDPTTDTLTAITAASADITNNAAAGIGGALGVGAGPEATPVVTNTASPSATTNFRLFVKNTGVANDTFDLRFDNDGVTPFGTLPTGISGITFFAGDGSGNPTGPPITNTGLLAAGASKKIIASATVASGVAGNTNIEVFFRAVSPTSTAADIVHDRVTVNTIRSLSLVPSSSGEVSAGGLITYSHLLTNTGNVTETSIGLTATNSASGFVTTIYLDSNGNGLIDPGELAITSVASLAAGASSNLIARVSAPSSAAGGTIDTMTLTATATGTINGIAAPAPVAIVDTTTVVAGKITLTKTMSPTGSAPPGATLTYTTTYTNTGNATVQNLVITDAIPSNTTYVAGSMTLNGAALTDAAGDDTGTLIGGSKGSVQCSVGTVASGVSGTVAFQVTID